MNKISAFWNLFHKGEEIANAAAWKNRQITGNVVAGVVLALAAVAKAYGFDLGLDDASALSLGSGIVVVVNCVLTLITSKKVGLPARSSTDVEGRAQSPFDDARGA